MKTKSIIGAITLIAVGVLFGAILVSSFGWVRPSLAEVELGEAEAPVITPNPDVVAFNDAFVNVAEKVTPSIVQITVVSDANSGDVSDRFKFFFPFKEDMPRQRQGGGSGVIISKDGYILTNNHVVENANSVTVTLHDKRELEAVVVGTDPLTDLAVVKINANDIQPAHMGNSDKLRVGQWVMAIGNPLALTSTVTAGIVSAIGRNIGIIGDSYGVEDFIQTDAAINPGNSGGGLFALDGSVVGINTAIATDGISSRYIGYGFAIPMNLAKTVAEDLIANGSVTRGYIGVRIEEVNDETAQAFGMDKPKGVLIQQVMPDGAASKADIKAGDIILDVNGYEVNRPNELQSYIATKRAGDDVELNLYRDGDNIKRTVTLKARDEDNAAAPVTRNPHGDSGADKDIDEMSFDGIGMTVRDMRGSELEEFGVENGIYVVKVEDFGRAYNQRIFRGLVISEVDRKEINSVKEFDEIMQDKKGDAVLLRLVDRQKNSRFVGLEIPD